MIVDVRSGCDGRLEAPAGSGCAGCVKRSRARMGIGSHGNWSRMSRGGSHAASGIDGDGFCAVVGVVRMHGVGSG